jgi:hypothetical protein
MKKKGLIVGCIGMAMIALLIFEKFSERNVWDVNASNLKEAFQQISSDEAFIQDLAEWTPFEWDTLYSFSPYTPKETIYKIIGYKWENINETVNEGINQVVFTHDGKVVCYLYGYPENNKIGFYFGKHDGSYIKLTTEKKLPFKMTKENNIRYFDYMKD